MKESARNDRRDQVVEKYSDLQELRRQQQMKKIVHEIAMLQAIQQPNAENRRICCPYNPRGAAGHAAVLNVLEFERCCAS
ncbi:MAG: hypothetical protein ACLP1W_04035 [Rhodomicrobium sp.]